MLMDVVGYWQQPHKVKFRMPPFLMLKMPPDMAARHPKATLFADFEKHRRRDCHCVSFERIGTHSEK